MTYLKISLALFFACVQLALFGQLNSTVPGAALPHSTRLGSGLSVMNGTASLGTSYTMSACGLNYVQVSNHLQQRPFVMGQGLSQPASFSVTGIPSCAVVIKAFLYVGISGNGIAVNAGLTNPAATASVFPMTLVGADVTNNWSTVGTYTYKSDITSLISGNGNYLLSGIPTTSSIIPNDADGATIFIVYSDPTQNYSGNIVIADGCQSNANNSGMYVGSSIGGFSVCSTPTLASNFMIIADLQQLGYTHVCFNTPSTSSLTPNYTKNYVTDQVWDFISSPVAPPSSGQTSANYAIYNDSDAVSIMLAGMYYRTNCVSCQQVTGNSPVCAGSTLSLSAIGAGTYTWQGPNGFTSNSQSVSIANASASITGIYTVTTTYSTGCSRTSTIDVQIAATPTITSNSPVCENSTLNILAIGGISYQWTGPAGFNSTAQNISIPAVPLTASGIYTLLTSFSSCSVTTLLPVTIKAAPAPFPSYNSPVCENAALQMSASVSTYSSYAWTGPNSFTSSAQNVVINPAQLNNAGTYSIVVTGTNACQTLAQIIVNINTNPLVTASGATVCYGAPAVLTASGASTYTWAGPGSLLQVSPAASVQQANANTSGVYTVTGASANSCVNSITVSLATIPSPTLVTTGTTVCTGQPATLTAGGALSYQWSGPGGFTSPAANIAIPVANNSSTGMYSVTGTAANSCSTAAIAILQIIPLPVISASATSTLICMGQTVTLSATGGQAYSWALPGTVTPTTGASVSVSPTVTTIYTVQGTSPNNCVNTTTVMVSVNRCLGLDPLMAQENAISVYPNPSNGTFIIKGQAAGNFSIVNGLGQLVRTISLNAGNYHELVVSGLADGIYYLISDDRAFKQKIIIEK